jgi:hypothetical protein
MRFRKFIALVSLILLLAGSIHTNPQDYKTAAIKTADGALSALNCSMMFRAYLSTRLSPAAYLM